MGGVAFDADLQSLFLQLSSTIGNCYLDFCHKIELAGSFNNAQVEFALNFIFMQLGE